jgi:hypothetical protein
MILSELSALGGDRRSAARRRVRRGARHHAKRHSHNLTEIAAISRETGALRGGVEARLATRIIACYDGVDGLPRTRHMFGRSLGRSSEWLLACAPTAVLR